MRSSRLVRTAIISISALMALSEVAWAMRPHKYLPTVEAKDAAYSTSISRIDAIGRDGATYSTPLVAVAYDTAIAIHWWKMESGSWNRLAFPHTALHLVPGAGDPVTVSKWSWSGEVGLAVASNAVFIIAKRQFGSQSGLQIKKFLWDGISCDLRALDATWSKIPLGSLGYTRSGFHLWARATPDGSLEILTQAFKMVSGVEVPRLVLLVLRDAASANAALAASWNVLEIGDGGWEFDGMIQGTNLACVYRAEPYAISVPVDLPAASQESTVVALSAEGVASFYAPLILKEIDLANLQIRVVESNLPGGDHPRFQRWEPRYIAVDRLQSGALSLLRIDVPYFDLGTIREIDRFSLWRKATISPPAPIIRAARAPMRFPRIKWKTTYTIDARNTAIGKTLLRRTTNGWIAGSCASVSSEIVPANIASVLPFQDMLTLAKNGSAYIRHATVQSPLPIFITNVTDRPSEKGEMIDVVYHRVKYESLFLSRYFVGTTGPKLTLQERAAEVLDLNHGQIRYWISENIQFWPWESKFVQYQFIDPPAKVRERKYLADNTLGGALTVELGGDRPRFMAYSDLGDGGARVVFDDNLPPPEPGGTVQKGFSEENVPGTTASVDTFVDIRQTASWEPMSLPSYAWTSSEAIVNGRDPSIDVLMRFVEGCGSAGCDIAEPALNAVEEQYHILSGLLGAVIESDASQDEMRARFSYYPASPFADNEVVFRAQSALPASSVAAYLWEFGDGTDPLSVREEVVRHRFHLSQDLTDASFDAKLTVTDVNGATAVSEASVPVRERLWRSLWRQHEALQVPDIARIGDITFSFSKYDLSYNVEDGRPSSISIRIRPEYLGQFKFLGNPYGQGFIDLRLPLDVRSEDVEVLGSAGTFYSVDKVHIGTATKRRFTPGILTEESRGADPLTEEFSPADMLGPNIAALACKPMEALSPDFPIVNVKGSLTWIAIGLIALATALVAIGLAVLAAFIMGQLAAAVAAATTPWGIIIAIAIIATLIVFVEVTVSAAVENYVENKIAESIGSSPMITNLDSTFCPNAGEGLAEALAVKAIGLAEHHAPQATGRNRLRPQYWQMVYVQDGNCRIWLRR